MDAITLGHDTVTIADNLSLGSDSSVLKFGADGDTTLTHTDGTGLTLNSTNKLCFNDASQFVQGSSATVLSIGATDEIDLTATAVDLNGTLNVSGVATFQATPVFPDGSLALADLDIDGATDIGADLVDADLFIVDDGAGGTNRKTAASRLKTYIGGGITNAQSFRLTTSFTGDAAPIASNWETVDTDGYGALGSAVSESSGIFSFGATGVYFIQFQWSGRLNADEKTYRGYIETTLDNSSYSEASEGRIFMQQTSSDNAHNSASVTFIFDVNDTSNRKCRFSVDPVSSSTETLGGTALSYTQATFIRLGDT